MGLFPEFKKPKKGKHPPTKQDFEWAEQLRHGLKSSRHTGWNRTAWANEFRILRQSVAPHTKRVTAALVWFLANQGKEYVPVIGSAKTFRAKFDRLEAAAARAERRSPSVAVSPEATKVVDRLKTLGWPRGEDQLPAAVQLTMTRYTAFHAALRALAARLEKKGGRLYRVAAHLVTALPDYRSFAEKWFRDVHARVTYEKSKWTGSFEFHTFHPGHERFAAVGQKAVGDYCHEPLLWDQIVQEAAREGGEG